MKIYTEVIYFWDDDKGELVQESSKSYDYNGPLTLCEDDSGSETTGIQYLKYPSTIGYEVHHWVSFSGYDFKSKANTLDIALYIPGDALSTSYKSEYESTSMGLTGDTARKAISRVGAGGFNVETIGTILKDTITAGKSEGGKVAMIEFAKGADTKITGAKAIMEKELGAVLNPYIVAAYKGPSDMRTHDFTFQMLPQDVNESKVCTQIASAFKKAMLPSHSGGNSINAPSMLFGYPDEFEITFTVNGKEMPKTNLNPMFSIGRSVLTACDLDFTTESTALFFEGTQYPVSISMKLSFMELEVLHRGKIDKGY
jgi:hypothetical protein